MSLMPHRNCRDGPIEIVTNAAWPCLRRGHDPQARAAASHAEPNEARRGRPSCRIASIMRCRWGCGILHVYMPTSAAALFCL